MNKTELKKALKKLGLKKGDHVILHSALSSIGYVTGGADTVIDAFLEVLGDDGTLVVPTFGKLGIITEQVKGRRNAVKSIHPRASVAAIGGKAEEICRDHWKAPSAHGEGTPYTKLRDLGGYICLLGVDHDRNTTLHTVEALLKLPYLSRTAEFTFDTPEGGQTKSWNYFPGPHRNFIGLDKMLTDSGKQKIGKVGNAVTRLIKSRDLIELGLQAGRKDPAFVLCDNPDCADCVRQRAAIIKDKIKHESFTVASSSAFAGYYIPEIADNLKSTGIDFVELDYIQGRAVARMSVQELKKIKADFKDAGIKVVSVRLNIISGNIKDILKTMAAARIGKVVMPLSDNAVTHARLAAKLKISISFFNVIHDSTAALRILLELRQKNITAGFTFNAANFARAGEHPFLGSFKTGIKKFIDGLDIEDAAYDGIPTAPAQGNAEIKEMISILQCGGFSGVMTLGAGNRQVTDPGTVVKLLADFAIPRKK